MFSAPIISKLGLIPTEYNHVMYSAYMNIYIQSRDQDGRQLPRNVFMTRQTIKGITTFSFTNASRILMGKDLAAHLN